MALYLPLNDHNRPIKQHLKREHYKMSTTASNNKPPNQECKNFVNLSDKDSADNSNRSSSLDSNITGKPHSQSSAPPRVMTINCGNNNTTNYNYNTITYADKTTKHHQK